MIVNVDDYLQCGVNCDAEWHCKHGGCEGCDECDERCPLCDSDVELNGDTYHCPTCGNDWSVAAIQQVTWNTRQLDA